MSKLNDEEICLSLDVYAAKTTPSGLFQDIVIRAFRMFSNTIGY